MCTSTAERQARANSATYSVLRVLCSSASLTGASKATEAAQF
jgi:hypothetical protein